MGWLNGTSAAIVDSTFTANAATSGGALFMQQCTGSLTLGASEVTYNSATNAGGSIFLVRSAAPPLAWPRKIARH